MTLSVPGTQPTKVWDGHIQTTIIDGHIHVTGRIVTDIHELNSFLSRIFPMPDAAKGASGQVMVNWEGRGPKDTSLEALRTEASTEISGTFDIQGKAPHLMQWVQEVAVDLHGTFFVRSEAAKWSLSPQSSLTGLIDMRQADLPTNIQSIVQDQDMPLRVTVPNGLEGMVNYQEGLYVEVQDAGCVQVKPKTSALSAQLCLTDWRGRLEQSLEAEGTYTLDVKVPGVRLEQVSCARSAWNLHGRMAFHDDNLEVSLNPRSTIELGSMKTHTVSIPSVTLRVQEGVEIRYGRKSTDLTIMPSVLNMELPYVMWKEQKVAFDGASVAIEKLHRSASTWMAQGSVNLHGVSTTIGDQAPPVTHWMVDVVLNPTEVFARILAHTDMHTIVTKARLTHSWKTNRGVMQAKIMPITFSPTAVLLSQTLQPWTYPFDIASGKFSALAHLFWNTSSHSQENPIGLEAGEVELGLHHLSGHFKQIMFEDITNDGFDEGGSRMGNIRSSEPCHRTTPFGN